MGNEILNAQGADGYVVQAAKAAAQAAHGSLLSEFIDAHKDSLTRDVKDSQNCADAIGADKRSIRLHQGHASHKRLIASAQEDIDGINQAIGMDGKLGDDQKNAAADQRVIDIDNRMLGQGNLTDAQRALINEDIASKQANIANCNNDVPNEQRYLGDDQAEIKALKTGVNVKQAGDAVVANRQEDLRLEAGYIAQNDSDARLNRRILEIFSIK
jgi:hypothetical protein